MINSLSPQLPSQYEAVKASKKREFNKNDIIEMLISEPFNIDINSIAETPLTVVVRIPREEYCDKNLGSKITRAFNACANCKEDMIIFQEA